MPDLVAQASRGHEEPHTLMALISSRIDLATPALIDGDPVSFSELHDRSLRFGAALGRLGIGAGDRVGIWLPNCTAWLVSFLACSAVGAIAVSINTRYRSTEVADLLHRSSCRTLILWPSFRDIDFAGILAQCEPAALEALTSIIAYGETSPLAGKPTHDFDALSSGSAGMLGVIAPESGCIIFTTSGTTKLPKLVLHDQARVVRHGFNVARSYGITRESRVILAPPLCGVFGFCTAMASFAAGCTLVLTHSWDAAAAARQIRDHRISHITASNVAISQVLDQADGPDAFASLQLAAYAALNPAETNVVERAESFGIVVAGLYGSSEMQALFSLRDPGSASKDRILGGGRPVSPLAHIRARDPETGAILPDGAIGELEFFAPESRMVGYFGDPAATAAAFTEDSYFRSGDLGYSETDGGFVYLARMGDSLRLSGFLVSPAEIEHVVQEHPAVAECQIVGVILQGEMRPVGFVIAAAGASFDESDVVTHVAARLARFKVPARLFPIHEFPTTPSANGTKVQKSRLRDLARAWLIEPA